MSANKYQFLERNGYTLMQRIADAEYDAEKDFGKSIEEAYRAIRERKAAGGPGWEPKP